jgi:hypothetical protein
MAYDFKTFTNASYFDWGNDARLFLTGAMSLGGWFRLDAGAVSGDIILRENNSFFGLDPYRIKVLRDSDTGGNGCGLYFEHELGGGGSTGVNCVPGLILAGYQWEPGQWIYMGFSRSGGAGGNTYSSFFGGRTRMYAAQTYTFAAAVVTVGGPSAIGLAWGDTTHGEACGPFQIWKRALTLAEHGMIAQCQVPPDTGTPDPDLMLWCQANTQPPDDQSTYDWTVNIHGAPAYEYDEGCASFGAGLDYRAWAG